VAGKNEESRMIISLMFHIPHFMINKYHIRI